MEYDIDSEDEEFLSNLNETKKIISEEKFEFAMDKYVNKIYLIPIISSIFCCTTIYYIRLFVKLYETIKL